MEPDIEVKTKILQKRKHIVSQNLDDNNYWKDVIYYYYLLSYDIYLLKRKP